MLPSRNAWRERNLWYLIPALPVALAAVAVEAGAPPLLSSLTVVVLLFWPWLAHQEGPSPEEDPEYDYLRHIRVKMYFAGLLFYLMINLVVVSVSVFLAAIFFFIWPLRAAILVLINRSLLGGDKSTINPRKDEIESFSEMILSVGGGTIQLGWAMFWIDILIGLRPILASANLSEPLIILLPFLYVLVVAPFVFLHHARIAWQRELTSRANARTLATLLRKRNWARTFDAKKRRGRR